MICPRCGVEISNNCNFCTYCGEPFHLAGTPALPTSAYKLDLGKLLENTFELYKRNFGTMCLVGLFICGIPFVFQPLHMATGLLQGIAGKAENTPLVAMTVGVDMCLTLLQMVLQWYVILGTIRQCLYTARGGTGVKMNLICPPLMMFLKYAGFTLVLFCIQFGITLLVIVPFAIGMVVVALSQTFDNAFVIGMLVASACLALPCVCVLIWINVRLYLTPFFLADQDTGIADSIIHAWRASSGNFWMLFIGTFVLGICAALGIFLCCVGLVLTAAVGVFGGTLAYMQLTSQPNSLDYPQYTVVRP